MNRMIRRNGFDELFDDRFGASSMNNGYNLMKKWSILIGHGNSGCKKGRY